MSDGAIGANDESVLILTYAFPPVAYVGVFRTLKYCKYLGRHGWNPIVVTARPGKGALVDEKLSRQIPEHVQVHRTADIDPAKWLARRGRTTAKKAASVTAEGTHGAAPQEPGRWRRLKKAIHDLLTNSPDSHIFWIPFALVAGTRILLKRQVQLIYCTSPPHSSHLVAYLLARCFNKPYILDFRDPWYVSGSIRSPDAKPSWVVKAETFAKRLVVRDAARVICATRGERDELRAEFAEIAPERFTFITNGYDSADFGPQVPGYRTSERLTIIHAGTIYPGIAGEFFQALRQLQRDHANIATKLRIQLLGEIADEYTDTVQALQQSGILERHGFLPHSEALRIVLDSDVLLILMGGEKYLPSHIPAKVFEYLHTGKPILAIARAGELAEIVRQSGSGVVVSPDSIDGISHALQRCCDDHASGQIQIAPNRSYIESFERSVLAERLATILDEVKRLAVSG